MARVWDIKSLRSALVVLICVEKLKPGSIKSATLVYMLKLKHNYFDMHTLLLIFLTNLKKKIKTLFFFYLEYLSSCFTSNVAANALDMEAIWNKVWLVTGLFHCVSVTPYPLANNRFPSLTTLTVKPGFWGWHFSACKFIVITCRYLKLHSNS